MKNLSNIDLFAPRLCLVKSFDVTSLMHIKAVFVTIWWPQLLLGFSKEACTGGLQHLVNYSETNLG